MSVTGVVAVDVSFADSTSVSEASSVKTVTLRNAYEYTATTGRVAVLSGTAGTAVTSLGLQQNTQYRDASGETVTLNAVSRIVYTWDGGSNTAQRSLAIYEDSLVPGQEIALLRSYQSVPAITQGNNFLVTPVLRSCPVTGSYQIILYSSQ